MKQGACLYENEAGCMSIWKWSRVHVDMKMKQGACLYENEAGCVHVDMKMKQGACRYENEVGCMSIWKWSRVHVDMKMKPHVLNCFWCLWEGRRERIWSDFIVMVIASLPSFLQKYTSVSLYTSDCTRLNTDFNISFDDEEQTLI